MVLIDSILIIFLIVLTSVMLVYLLYKCFSEKLLPMQFNWLVVALIISIIGYILILFIERINMCPVCVQYLSVYMFLSSFLFLGLFFTKFNGLFSNLFTKKLYIFINMIGCFLLVVIFIIVLMPTINEHVFVSIYAGVFNITQPTFLFFFILPFISVVILLTILYKKSSVLNWTSKSLVFLYVLKFFIFIFVTMMDPVFNNAWFFTVYLTGDVILKSLLMKNIIVDGGRYGK